jgi:hypothetical protein
MAREKTRHRGREERRSNNRRERAQEGKIYMDGKDEQDGGGKERPQIYTDKHRSGMANGNLAELCGPQGQGGHRWTR